MILDNDSAALNVQERLREITSHTAVQVLRVKNTSREEWALRQIEAGACLEDLNESEVFSRRLDAAKITGEKRKDLMDAFAEILVLVRKRTPVRVISRMKILNLRFRNLNSLAGEWAIDFQDPELASSGIFAITGPTGSGKTTILDAICLACTARLPAWTDLKKQQRDNVPKYRRLFCRSRIRITEGEIPLPLEPAESI